MKISAMLGNSGWELHKESLVSKGTNATAKTKCICQTSENENAARLDSNHLNITITHITQRTLVYISLCHSIYICQ
jgi:hypothetical protein